MMITADKFQEMLDDEPTRFQMILENGSDERIVEFCEWLKFDITCHTVVGFVKVETEEGSETLLRRTSLKLDGKFLGIIKCFSGDVVGEEYTTYYLQVAGVGALIDDLEVLSTRTVLVRKYDELEFMDS